MLRKRFLVGMPRQFELLDVNFGLNILEEKVQRGLLQDVGTLAEQVLLN